MAATPTPIRPAVRAEMSISTFRRAKNLAFWVMMGFCLLLLVVPVVWIIDGTVAKAVPGWSWSVLWNTSGQVPPGLSNAIVGTLWLALWMGILAAVVGIGAGIYLAEIAPGRKHAAVLRSGTEVLAGIPSIVFGYVAYLTLVVGLHWGYGVLPASIAVALLVVPYVAKSTELALNQVPIAYREGGEALGMPRTLVLRRVVLRSAIPGILTGLILALAIAVGETAPLLYTAGFSNDYPKLQLTHSAVGYLPGAIWNFYNSPDAAEQQLAKDGSVILIAMVLLLILATRLVVRLTQKFSPNRSQEATGRRARRAVKEAKAAAAAHVAEARAAAAAGRPPADSAGGVLSS